MVKISRIRQREESPSHHLDELMKEEEEDCFRNDSIYISNNQHKCSDGGAESSKHGFRNLVCGNDSKGEMERIKRIRKNSSMKKRCKALYATKTTVSVLRKIGMFAFVAPLASSFVLNKPIRTWIQQNHQQHIQQQHNGNGLDTTLGIDRREKIRRIRSSICQLSSSSSSTEMDLGQQQISGTFPVTIKEGPPASETQDSTYITTANNGTNTTMKAVRMPPQSKSNDSVDNSKSRSKYYIPREQLDRLLQSINLVSLIEAYQIPQFRRTGDGFQATCLCPFHDDHNPSLKVDAVRGIFKCFSCGAGGNAISFVRDYAKLHTGQQLSFVEAVRLLDDIRTTSSATSQSTPESTSQSSKIISLPNNVKVPMAVRPPAVPRDDIMIPTKGLVGATGIVTVNNKNGTAADSTLTPAQQQQKRQRLLLANLHAAAFYEQNLFSLPTAGSARAHLRERKIHPYTVKAYSIGFAPETYFVSSTQSSSPSTLSWGEGSLVNHLRGRGFTPQEILDAGLAIQTKRSRLRTMNTANANNEGAESSGSSVDYTDLMDRFRGRLVVPIFDGKGNHVVGFGGRILENKPDEVKDGGEEEGAVRGDVPTISSKSKRYKAAKYLNSPESLVFQKKNLLFGQHMLSSLTRKSSKEQAKIEGSARCVLIVEGYMDAIALWQAGVKESVASMGTAISFDQLSAAAQSSRSLGGRIVLCLDNDEAGQAAVKRLCIGTKPIFYQVTEAHDVELHVASLPKDVKDPAEFLELRDGSDDPGQQFRDEVITKSVDWTEWYTMQTVNHHIQCNQEGEGRAFSDLFEELCSFIAVFESSTTRSKLATILAPKLGDLIDSDSEFRDERNGSAVHSQIESDLLERSASIIHSRTVASQLTVEIDDESQLGDYWLGKIDSALPPSLAISMSFDDELDEKGIESDAKVMPPPISAGAEPVFPKRRTKRQRARITRQRKSRKQAVRETSMTPHINGIKANPLDDQWLMEDTRIDNAGVRRKYNDSLSDSNVRFNSNQYYGKWMTDDASFAGYNPSMPEGNIDFLTKGSGALVGLNEEEMTFLVEDALLRLIIRSKKARSSLSRSIAVSEASGAGCFVDWSSPEKRWLFECVLNEIDPFPDEEFSIEEEYLDDVDVGAIRAKLARRPDVPDGAFAIDGAKDPETLTTESNPPDTSAKLEILQERFEDVLVNDVSSIRNKENFDEPAKSADDVDIPEIGEEFGDGFDDFLLDDLPGSEEKWSDLESLSPEISRLPMNENTNDQNHVGPISSADKMESIDAAFTTDAPVRGILDHIFDSDDDLNINTDDENDTGTEARQEKQIFAVQNLFTILQSTSVLRRIRVGRLYLSGVGIESLLESSQGNVSASSILSASTLFQNDTELVEYCSSTSLTGNGVSLRGDLQRFRSLTKANKRATDRVYSLMEGGFSDENLRLKGYNWLGNVLQFNKRRLSEGWSEMIESTEGFQPSAESSEEVIDDIESTWEELSDENVMWDLQSVRYQRSPWIEDLLNDEEEDDSSNDEVLEWIEDDWDWVNK